MTAAHLELPELIRQLMLPENYPHPVQSPVRLEQTHISYVLLTGDWAYKIKKPVNLGFLDFTTLEKRRHFCEQELMLNRRFAPEIYQAVMPLFAPGTWKTPFDQGAGEAMEYALKMREFPQKSLFRVMFDDARLSVKHLQDLGKRLAGWHRASPSSAEVRAYGAVEVVRQVASDNFEATRPFIGSLVSDTVHRETCEAQLGFIENNTVLFEERQKTGMVRECHGDLHLNNVCWFTDQARAFDCIEFNKEFRCIDVLYDTAFMVMDLLYRKRPDLAYGFLNAWIEHTGDYEGSVLLPFYVGMRSMVRAKVKSQLSVDPHLLHEKRADLQKQTSRFYQLAHDQCRLPQGKLWAVCGFSGSGKSTVASWLARHVGAIHVRSDSVRKHISGIPLDKRGDESLYTPEQTKLTYQTLESYASSLCRHGLNVVLDATYSDVVYRDSLRTMAGSEGLEFSIINCRAPVSVMRERLHSRQQDISDADPEVLEKQLVKWRPFSEIESAFIRNIDTQHDWQDQLKTMLYDKPRD